MAKQKIRTVQVAIGGGSDPAFVTALHIDDALFLSFFHEYFGGDPNSRDIDIYGTGLGNDGNLTMPFPDYRQLVIASLNTKLLKAGKYYSVPPHRNTAKYKLSAEQEGIKEPLFASYPRTIDPKNIIPVDLQKTLEIIAEKIANGLSVGDEVNIVLYDQGGDCLDLVEGKEKRGEVPGDAKSIFCVREIAKILHKKYGIKVNIEVRAYALGADGDTANIDALSKVVRGDQETGLARLEEVSIEEIEKLAKLIQHDSTRGDFSTPDKMPCQQVDLWILSELHRRAGAKVYPFTIGQIDQEDRQTLIDEMVKLGHTWIAKRIREWPKTEVGKDVAIVMKDGEPHFVPRPRQGKQAPVIPMSLLNKVLVYPEVLGQNGELQGPFGKADYGTMKPAEQGRAARAQSPADQLFAQRKQMHKQAVADCIKYILVNFGETLTQEDNEFLREQLVKLRDEDNITPTEDLSKVHELVGDEKVYKEMVKKVFKSRCAEIEKSTECRPAHIEILGRIIDKVLDNVLKALEKTTAKDDTWKDQVDIIAKYAVGYGIEDQVESILEQAFNKLPPENQNRLGKLKDIQVLALDALNRARQAQNPEPGMQPGDARAAAASAAVGQVH